MTSPFAMFQVKVFPHTEQVCVEGVMLNSAEGLWLFLMERAEIHPAVTRATRVQQSGTSPEIEAFLARGGVIKRPEKKASKETKVSLSSIDDLISKSLKGEL